MKKEYCEKDLLLYVEKFLLKFKSRLPLNYRKEVLKVIRSDSSFLESLSNEPGIYYFLQNNMVKYVGRALPSVGLKKRIQVQISAYGDIAWDSIINDEEVEIGVIIFKHEDWYFTSALEHYLIEKLEKPIFNKRF